MLDKILCPIDFSPGSEHAMKVAVEMAKRSGAALVLAHSWYLPAPAISDELPFSADTIRLMIEDEEQGLAAAVKQATALGAKQVQTLFLTGTPAGRLVDAVHADRAIGLVVMGTHGRTGLARILLGSVAEKVVRLAPCSVLVTRGEATTFKRILCPIDFSESCRHAVDAAAEVAQRMAAEITLLHVVEVPITYSGEPPIAGFVADLGARSARVLDQWATELRARVSTAVTTRTAIGSPGAETLAVLDGEPRFDLAIVGSHGRRGIQRVLLGSVAEKIVRHAPCAVMVARARHDA